MIDLGILPNGAGEWPLATLLDHTHSARARQALLDILAQPLVQRDDITNRQQLFRALPALTREFDWKGIGGLLLEVDAYLESNFVIFPTSTIDATVFALRYPDATKFIERGQRTFARLLDFIVRLRERLTPVKFDSRFQVLVNAFDAVLDTSIVDETRHAAAPTNHPRNAVCRLDRRVRVEMRDRLLALIAAFHQFDAYCSLAVAAQKPGLVMPQIVDKVNGSLSIAGLHHPLLPGGTVNDIVPGEDRVMFLTGPNMAGKSTLLRALGIAVTFAHLGLPVPASAASIPLTDRVIASLGNEDSIVRAESLYLAEVRRVKGVAAAVAAGEAVVALLDEVFRGTNVKDASDATTLLVHGLARAECGLFAVSSHLIEVAEANREVRGVGYWHLETLTQDGEHTFSYRLVSGISDVRLGMELLRREGVVRLLDKIGRQSTLRPDVPVRTHNRSGPLPM